MTMQLLKFEVSSSKRVEVKVSLLVNFSILSFLLFYYDQHKLHSFALSIKHTFSFFFTIQCDFIFKMQTHSRWCGGLNHE